MGFAVVMLLAAVALVAGDLSQGATLEVGPGKPLARIEEANAKAQPGDLILVYPRPNDQPYEQTAVFVRQRRLTFRAVPSPAGHRVKVSGKGFDYSGQGSTPRAIFQFNPGTDDCLLEGFDLSGAHNSTHNGAGVRINQANRVTILNCAIHDNDMGIMSNGDGSLQKAVDQRIEHCQIYRNGDPADPGYNHNLYLGGTSVSVRFCEVASSTTGHNVKSRAHHTRVEYCYVHHSANREFDLVDAAETAQPDSHAVLLGNVVVKDPRCAGNRNVIHFGQDGGKEHDGTLYLAFNTIVTPFLAPVVDLSAPKAKLLMVGNLVCDGGARQQGQKVAGARGGASLSNVGGMHNWFCGGFSGAAGVSLDLKTNVFQRVDVPLFVNPAAHDYHLRAEIAHRATTPLSARRLELPAPPGLATVEPPLTWQYRHPAGKEKRRESERLTLGAYGRNLPDRRP